MSNHEYGTFTGTYICQDCGLAAHIARFWYETKDMTWRCPDGHISTVSLRKETKSERKERAKSYRGESPQE